MYIVAAIHDTRYSLINTNLKMAKFDLAMKIWTHIRVLNHELTFLFKKQPGNTRHNKSLQREMFIRALSVSCRDPDEPWR